MGRRHLKWLQISYYKNLVLELFVSRCVALVMIELEWDSASVSLRRGEGI
jgi:hypothetical protein